MDALTRTIAQFVTRLDLGLIFDLLTTRGHAPYLARHRAEVIVTRVRLVAAAFSGLTLLWIALDALTLERSQWLAMAALRVVASIVFAFLALLPAKERSQASALRLLALLLAVPLVLYVTAQYFFSGLPPEGPAAINFRLYDALPFIVLAGLSVFPLVIFESLALAVPILIMTSFGMMVASGFDWVKQLSTMWVLLLILCIYLMAGAIQLRYMIALVHRASFDPLTGALTRRSGTELIEFFFRLACEQNTHLAVVFVDLDNFKNVNDTYGHDEGDKSLRSAADALSRIMRSADAVIRWGGEEFVVLMTNADTAGVKIALARLTSEWLGTRPDGAPLTASIGVAERIADSTDDWATLVSLADKRMYHAKLTGKARYVLPEDEEFKTDPTVWAGWSPK